MGISRPEIGLRHAARQKAASRGKAQIHRDTPARANRPGTSNTYAGRNSTLLEMGFPSYNDYLASDLWTGIRNTVWQGKGRQCYLCAGVANVLHHISYGRETLKGEDVHNIVPICNSCHYLVEYNYKGHKRPLANAQNVYRKLLRKSPMRKKLGLHKRRTAPSIISKRGFWICCGKRAKNKSLPTCPYCLRCLACKYNNAAPNDNYCRPCGEGQIRVYWACGHIERPTDNGRCSVCHWQAIREKEQTNGLLHHRPSSDQH